MVPGTLTGKKDIVEIQHRELVSCLNTCCARCTCDLTRLQLYHICKLLPIGIPCYACHVQGEGTGAEKETSFEFHRQRFCYNDSIHMFEKLKFPTRVQSTPAVKLQSHKCGVALLTSCCKAACTHADVHTLHQWALLIPSCSYSGPGSDAVAM